MNGSTTQHGARAPPSSGSGVALTLVSPQRALLLKDARSGTAFAVDLELFGRQTPLPALEHGEEQWEMDIEGGYVFFGTDRRSIWYTDLATRNLYADGQGSLYIAQRAPDGRPLAENFDMAAYQHIVKALHLPVDELGREVSIEIAVFKQELWGSAVSFSIGSFYDEGGLTLHPGIACSWFQKRAKLWRSIMESLEIPPMHAVRASAPWTTNIPKNQTDALRCLTFNSLNSHATIAIFCILAFGHSSHGGLKDAMAQQRFKQFLRSLLKLVRQPFEMDRCLRGDAKWIYGAGLEGHGLVTLLVDDNPRYRARGPPLLRPRRCHGLDGILADLDEAPSGGAPLLQSGGLELGHFARPGLPARRLGGQRCAYRGRGVRDPRRRPQAPQLRAQQVHEGTAPISCRRSVHQRRPGRFQSRPRLLLGLPAREQ